VPSYTSDMSVLGGNAGHVQVARRPCTALHDPAGRIEPWSPPRHGRLCACMVAKSANSSRSPTQVQA
jgi:hypothetical protein